MAKNKTVRKIIKVLKNDKNSEVINFMAKVKNVEDIEVELEKNVNIKFIDKMKFVSSEFGISRIVALNYIFKESKFADKKEEKKPETKESENMAKKEGENEEKEI